MRIWTLNCGSSSIKAAVYEEDEPVLTALLDCIGQPRGSILLRDAHGLDLVRETSQWTNHEMALDELLNRLPGMELSAVGHRVVHGGLLHGTHQRVTPELIAELRRIVPFVPLHLPAEIAAMEAVARRMPELPQFACFDTAFHRSLPDVARVLPLPRRFAEQGIYRHGFHGLSYEYLVHELRHANELPSRVVLAHLGNGCSMAAVRDGTCVDTTMSFTPNSGLVMGTRSGDLDPGLIVYLLRDRGMSIDDVDRLIQRESGLLGISGISSDVRDLESAAGMDGDARLALDVFAYQARKQVGALASALGGLEALVFTGGIGEHAASIRSAICGPLEFLGIRLDAQRNARHERLISVGSTRVFVLRTNEEWMIARHVRRLLTG